MYLPCFLSAASNSDIEKRRSRETAGKLPYHATKRSRRLMVERAAPAAPQPASTTPQHNSVRSKHNSVRSSSRPLFWPLRSMVVVYA